MARRSIHSLTSMKKRGERFAMVTCYDYPSARLAEEVGFPGVLVGDSLGTAVLGYDSTVPVTLEEILHHTKPVVRGSERMIVVADLPFGTYRVSTEEAMRNASRLLQEGGATAVKLEGGASVAPTVARMVEAGIPVMGHLGLTPQSVRQFGGHKVQGKTDAAAARMLDDAVALEQAGAFAVVLECIPAPLAGDISRALMVPTIGIGAGINCDAEIQVWHDILGLFEDFLPKHSTNFAKLAPQMRHGLENYMHAVRHGEFPTDEQSFDSKPSRRDILALLFEELDTVVP
jgi:3-methyl-2-oxobutanoate hydroxymethyltransferase